jgi:hypothetical protein
MKLDLVMEEVAQVLRSITGLNVHSYPADRISPPAGYLSYPESIAYDGTYQRGDDSFVNLPIVLLASKVTDRTARDRVAEWSAGSGPKSIKGLLEAWSWTSCDDLTVNSCEFNVERIAGIDYLAVMFKATVVGPGEED